MNRSESIAKLSAALVKAQRSMGNATKGAKNPFFKNTYADLNAIREVALPPLNDNGISVLQPTSTDAEGSYVDTLLLHESGEFLTSRTRVLNTKGDAQGEGSGISYARRYGLQSLLNIGAVDDDGEAAVGRKEVSNAKEEPKKEPVKMVQPVPTASKPAVKEAGKPMPAAPKATARPNKEVITEAFKKLEADKKVTKETFKTKYLSGAGLSTMNDTQAAIALIKIQTDFPGVIV